MHPKISLDNIIMKNSSAFFNSNFQFQVSFSVNQTIKQSLAWKVIYVGSAINEDYDQILEEFQVDPFLCSGSNRFQISCPPPNPYQIPFGQLLCVTALIITASYRKQEFIRVGYYVHNQLLEDWTGEQTVQMPIEKLVCRIKRTIISDKPRITKFNIDWSDQNPQMKQNQERGEQKTLIEFLKSRQKNRISKPFIKGRDKYLKSQQLQNRSSEKQSTQNSNSMYQKSE